MKSGLNSDLSPVDLTINNCIMENRSYHTYQSNTQIDPCFRHLLTSSSTELHLRTEDDPVVQ